MAIKERTCRFCGSPLDVSVADLGMSPVSNDNIKPDKPEHAPTPSAYLLIGDEPPSDRIVYFGIPSPVFTLPIGKDNPDTNWHYKTLAEKTGGKMLHMEFQ